MSRILLPRLMVGLAGEFRVQVCRSDGSVRHDTGWFPNLITDIGLDRLGTNSDFLLWCRVGTGTATPVVGDTQLASQVASTSTPLSQSNTNAGSAPYYNESVRTYQFGVGVAAGNLAEVGIGWSTSGASLFSRARILDGFGNPTTITVLSTEFLNVSYRVRQFAPAADRTGSFPIGSGVYDYTARASTVTSWSALINPIDLQSSSAVAAYTGAIGAVTGAPTGGLGSGISTFAAYSAGTYYRDVSTVWAPATGIGTHRSYTLNAGGRGSYQFELSPTIVKTSLDQLTLTFRVGWQRIVGTG